MTCIRQLKAGVWLFLLAFALAFAGAVQAAYADAVTFTAGNLTYKVQADGTAYVGTGATDKVALVDTSVKDVVIPATVSDGSKEYTVTGVSTYAFYRCSGLRSVSFPATVKRIDAYAFAECGTMTGEKKNAVYSGLTTVTFPADTQIELIGSNAFYRCYALKAFTFPKSLKTISEKAFMSCYSFTYFKCEEGTNLTSIGSGCFEQELPVHNEEAAEDAVLGKEVENIIGTSEDSYGGLKTVSLPGNITYLGSGVFENQRDLTSINFETDSIPYLGYYMFAFCTGLTKVEVPKIEGYQLKPDRMVALGQYTFAWCPELTTFVFGGDIGTVSGRYSGLEMFDKDTKLTTVVYKGKEVLPSTNWRPVVDSSNINGSEVYDASAWDYGFTATDPTLYYQVTFYANKDDAQSGTNPVGKAVIRKGTALSSITSALDKTDAQGTVIYEGSVPNLPAGTDAWAFEIGNSLSTLTDSTYAYPVDSTDLSYGAVNVPQTVWYTGNEVELNPTVSNACGVELSSDQYTLQYERKTSSGSWQATSDLTSTGALRAVATSTAGAKVSGSVSTEFQIALMPRGTKFTCDGVNYIVSKAPTEQGGGEVQVGDGASLAVDKATAGDFVIPATVNPGNSKISYAVTSVGDYAFGGKSADDACTALTSVTLPDGITYIGLYAFANCNSLTSVTLPSTLDEVNACAFYSCSALTAVDFLGTSMSSIGASAFARCMVLSSVVLPKITLLEGNSFANCVRLKTVVFKGNVSYPASTQFSGCESIENVLYMGANWGYDFGSVCMVYKTSSTSAASLVRCCKTSSAVTVPASVTFSGKSYKVTSIGAKAFSKCKKVKTVTIASKTMKSFKNAFKSSKVVTVKVPAAKKAAYKKLLKKSLCGKGVKVL